jgi:peptidoglycan/xylan/chitin deacetylase (PgdA/CDA1 family)
MTLNKKTKKGLINLLIILVVVLLFVLIDFLVVNFRSSPANDKEEVLGSAGKPSIELVVDETAEKLEPNEKVFLPILNFHHIGTAPAGVSATTRTYYISPDKFEAIVLDMISAGYKFVFVSEAIDLLEQGIRLPENVASISFDDGNANYYTNAWPVLQKHGVKSSVYIMTGVGGENYLSDEQIKELFTTELVEFGSHTIYHPKLTKIAPDERMKELEQSKEELDELLNTDVDVIAYPFGLYNDDVKKLASALGYDAGLTFDQDAWQDPQDLMEIKRISVYPNLNVIKFLEKLKNQ